MLILYKKILNATHNILEKVPKQFDLPTKEVRLGSLSNSTSEQRSRKHKTLNCCQLFFFYSPRQLSRGKKLTPGRSCSEFAGANVPFHDGPKCILASSHRGPLCVVLIFAKWINVWAKWQRWRCPADSKILDAPQFGQWICGP